MAFNIEFDYRFDTNGFFTDPARRAALEAAADTWEVLIKDEFADIPAGHVFTVRNPQSFSSFEKIVLTKPIDDLLVFVGATSSLPPIAPGIEAAARAGPSFAANGDIFQSRVATDFRGTGPVTDFEPWTGLISFNANYGWTNADEIRYTAIHELGHVLGIGTAPAFDALTVGATFAGVNTQAVNGGNSVPLSSDLSHVEEGFADDTVALDPSFSFAKGVSISAIDRALLADIGYDIDGFARQGTQTPIASASAETIFGTDSNDNINALAGNDDLSGGTGNDVLIGGLGNDRLFGGQGADVLSGGFDTDSFMGNEGGDLLISNAGDDDLFGQQDRDTYFLTTGGGIRTLWDFDSSTEQIVVLDSSFADTAALLASVTRPFFNLSQITLADGTQIRIATDDGTLTPANIALAQAQTGGQGDDAFNETAGFDLINAGTGTDVVQFGGLLASYSVLRTAGEQIAVKNEITQGWNLLDSVERLKFTDGTLAFDTDSTAGQAYRLYQAAFDRTPDAPGLGFWIDELDKGRVSLTEAAGNFMISDEYTAAYGPPQSQSSDAFLTLLYNNVLDRTPDAAGFAFWQHQQNDGMTRAEIIGFFSESAENIAKTTSAIEDGIWFT